MEDWGSKLLKENTGNLNGSLTFQLAVLLIVAGGRQQI